MSTRQVVFTEKQDRTLRYIAEIKHRTIESLLVHVIEVGIQDLKDTLSLHELEDLTRGLRKTDSPKLD